MTLNTILKKTAIATIFSVFIIPFIVPGDMFFPFITGKGFLFRVLVEIGFAAWLLLSLRDASVRPRKSWVLWAFGAFVAVIGIADIFGVNPWKSFWSNFERMEGYITILHIFLYFIVASSVLATEKLWKRFLEWSVWSSLAMSLYGFLQLSGVFQINQGGVRVDGTFGNATYLAIYAVFNIFFALILINRDKELWKKISYGVIAFLDFIILYHTATRGSILGLLGGLLLSGLLIAIFDKGERKIRIAAASIVGAVILLVIGFIGVRHASFVANSPVLSRFASISWADTQTQARAYIWPMAIKGWEEKPVLGWGQENFNYIFNANYDPRMYSQEQWFDHAHNTVLDWLVAGGLLGLLAYLSLFVTAVWLLWKKSPDVSFTEKALFTGLGAAYFFHNLFVFDNLVSYILFVAVLAFIHFKATRLEKPVASEKGEIDGDDIRMAGPIILVALAFAVWFFNWRGYETNLAMIDGLRATSVSPVQAQAALDGFARAASYDTLGRPELVERVIGAVPAMNSDAVPLDIRQKFAELAKGLVDAQIARFPGDARYETFAGTFYSSYGQAADAEKHYLEAVKLSPKKQTILFQVGSFYITSKQYDKAIATFKEAYDLDHSFATAAQYYAMSLAYAGRETEAKAVLAQAGLDTSMTDDNFLRAYIDADNWTKVLSILKARIAANPKDVGSMQNLAAAYYQMGNKAMAVATFRQIETVDPSLKAQVEQYIQAIQNGQ
ncbi:MAG TPA: O-antigen ligase family protein [Candidatus Paceibacterota bacterium]|nr:O-antigen ligase family protein [Candidatus Paceibacterota bacterium]